MAEQTRKTNVWVLKAQGSEVVRGIYTHKEHAERERSANEYLFAMPLLTPPAKTWWSVTLDKHGTVTKVCEFQSSFAPIEPIYCHYEDGKSCFKLQACSRNAAVGDAIRCQDAIKAILEVE